MQQQTIKEVLEHEPGIRAEEFRVYVIRDEQTVFYVGQSQNTYNRFLAHLGLDERTGASLVGTFIRENAPASGAWLFEQYTVEECRPFVEQRRAALPEEIRAFFAATGNHYDADDAEEALIKLHRPYFNTAKNPHSLPLPGCYKSSYRDGLLDDNAVDYIKL
jgi:hypothetical protein